MLAQSTACKGVLMGFNLVFLQILQQLRVKSIFIPKYKDHEAENFEVKPQVAFSPSVFSHS